MMACDRLTDMEQLYQRTKSMADQALTQAQNTYTQSLTIYTESESLTITKVDTAGLKNEAADVKSEVSELDFIPCLFVSLVFCYYFDSFLIKLLVEATSST